MGLKKFVSFQEMRDNGLLMAYRMYHEDKFFPDVIYASLRGGAYLGNIISEYFKFLRGPRHPVFYAAVVARSYQDTQEQSSHILDTQEQSSHIKVDGWTYHPDHLRHGDKILLVDEIYDSGNTLTYLAKEIIKRGIPREDIKIIVNDYKCYHSSPRKITPDYYANKYDIHTTEEDFWIHYLSHELVGLTQEEIQQQYEGRVKEILKKELS